MHTAPAPWEKPVFFQRNRVFRVYSGGKLFSDFLGDPPEDGNYPEEWVASAVRAINPGHADPLEGISRRAEDGMPFHDILAQHPAEYLGDRTDIGVLVKFLDSAIRLPMQAHPTREYSRVHFHSPYGKAEAWLILATRPGACIYFGFDRKLTKAEFAAAVEQSRVDPDAMTEFVNRVPVQSGDVFFVEAGVIHAIGAGCLLLEIQEPTDFTIQPEYHCGAYPLSAQEMYLGLDPDIALDCFDFSRYGSEVVQHARKTPRLLRRESQLLVESLIGPEDTPCFRMERYTLDGGAFSPAHPASIWICVSGETRVRFPGGETAFRRGSYFFLPAAAVGKCEIVCEKHAEIVACMGGK